MLWGVLLAVIFLAWHFAQIQEPVKGVPLSEMLTRIERGEITFVSVHLQGNGPAAVFCAYAADDSCVRSTGVFSDSVMSIMRREQVPFEVRGGDPEAGWAKMLVSWAPFILLIGFWVFFIRQNKGVNVGDTKKAIFSRLDKEPAPQGTVVGVAAAALAELRSLASGQPNSVRVLLAGPSGSGKSHLLRSLFAPSDRPCLVATSASLVELFLGVGAARIRDLMVRARREKAAAVIIDGLDELCPQRVPGGRGERDERVQAAQQLAAGLDDLQANPAFAFIAVTNRPDLLDEAIVRRFDRVLTLEPPDVDSRAALLREMLASAPGIDVASVAARTEGWLPSDLVATVSDAARRAGSRRIAQADVDAAIVAREDVRRLMRRDPV